MRTILLLIIAVLIGGLAALNWEILAAPSEVNLGLTTIHAPLGILMLGLTLLLCVLFIAYVLSLQGSVMLEARRHNKEMTAQRELADKAEASRFTDLRAHLDKEVGRLSEVIHNHTRETLSRVDRAEMGLRERPVDADIARLAQAVENHNRDLHARVDRLEMGLRDGLAGYVPAPASLRPAPQGALPPQQPPSASDPVGSDPVGSAIPR